MNLEVGSFTVVTAVVNMGKKSKKGSKAGKGRPGAGKGKQSSSRAVQTTTAPSVLNIDHVAVLPSVGGADSAVSRISVPSVTLDKEETRSPVSVADIANEAVSYDEDDDLVGKANAPVDNSNAGRNLEAGPKQPLITTFATSVDSEKSSGGEELVSSLRGSYLSVSEASLPEDALASKQQRPTVSFSNEVVITETNDASRSVIEASLSEDAPISTESSTSLMQKQPTVSSQDDVFISENYDASRSVIEVYLSSPNETSETTEQTKSEVAREQDELDDPEVSAVDNKVTVVDENTPSLSAKLDDILTETTENFFASKESPLRQEFGSVDSKQNDDELAALEATDAEAGTSNVSTLLNMHGMEASFIEYAHTFTVPADLPVDEKKTLTSSNALNADAPVESSDAAVASANTTIQETSKSEPTSIAEFGLDNVNVAKIELAKVDVQEGSVDTAHKEVSKPKDGAATAATVSLTEPGPAEKSEKTNECCIIL